MLFEQLDLAEVEPLEGGMRWLVPALVAGAATVASPDRVSAVGLHYRVDGSGPDVVLIHGFQTDLREWDDVAAGLPIPGPLGAALQPQLGVDATTGNTASITPGNGCLQWTMPVPAPVKLTVKATRGSGAVGAQIYRKKKAW